MSENKVIKSVSFNKVNKQDDAILRHVKRLNFSGYVKKLILADMETKEAPQEAEPLEVKEDGAEPIFKTVHERIEWIKNQAKKQGNINT